MRAGPPAGAAAIAAARTVAGTTPAGTRARPRSTPPGVSQKAASGPRALNPGRHHQRTHGKYAGFLQQLSSGRSDSPPIVKVAPSVAAQAAEGTRRSCTSAPPACTYHSLRRRGTRAHLAPLAARPVPRRPAARRRRAIHRHMPRRPAAAGGHRRGAVAQRPRNHDQPRAPLVPVGAPLEITPPSGSNQDYRGN
jgi:hypothetical protein